MNETSVTRRMCPGSARSSHAANLSDTSLSRSVTFIQRGEFANRLTLTKLLTETRSHGNNTLCEKTPTNSFRRELKRVLALTSGQLGRCLRSLLLSVKRWLCKDVRLAAVLQKSSRGGYNARDPDWAFLRPVFYTYTRRNFLIVYNCGAPECPFDPGPDFFEPPSLGGVFLLS